MSRLVVKRWSEEEWLESRVLWNELLADSTGNELFGSWEWQTGWWRHFGKPSGWQLWLLAFEEEGKTVGFLPAYAATVRRRRIPARSVQLIGHHFRSSDVLISEYLDVIARPDNAHEVAAAGLDHLIAGAGCDEFVLCSSRATGVLRNVMLGRAPERGWYCRTTDSAEAYGADLTGGFEGYLKTLGDSTRRSVYSLRRRLGDLGRVRFDMAPEGEIDAWLDMLNQLHATRWGETAFSGARLHFHREFARALSRQGRLALSRLWIGDRVVSVLYDVRGRQAQYNLQMGFDGQLGARVSLGLLHLGYAMEDASTRGLGYYDFLAGPGRSTQYKARLGQAPGAICSTQLITAPWLGGLHRAYDFVSRAN